ncbi:TonB-dependent receptor [Olivibacter sp. SDN3]|uniref:SusC/RagA family TonB-linked outer membrane protein n=1 Tax=Olivibacter sp. SDN3 TaxID=2764720 RepID=UPI0016510645|nr:TonB-dependent receptor [Olivibacter sp. SDN3]QNL49560.1 TonB-dependent receptor [Olivibacter sp. SDN3]
MMNSCSVKLMKALFIVFISHLFLITDVFAQETITVTGTVRDSAGVAIPGVSIRVKDAANLGTTTNEQGRYVIDVAENAIFQISYVGYVSREIFVNGAATLNITLQTEEGSLEEVVVVGFGVQRKISSIGAQSTVRPTELKTPVRNLTTVLAGRMSGIVGVQRSGEPGYDNANLWIRGRSSLGSSNPLVLVDGVERPMDDVDPEDIESFSILKDASATAVYGVRGANGVILINTRKGKVQATSITVGYNEGLTQLTKIPELVNAPQFMRLANEANTTRGRNPIYSEDAIYQTENRSDPDLYPDVNWNDELFDNSGRNRRLNLNMTGGSDRAQFYVSGAYYSEVGLLKRDDMQKFDSKIGVDRYNFTSNLSLKATGTTTVDLGVQGFILDGTYPGYGTNEIYSKSMDTPPNLFPLVYSNGYFGDLRGGNGYLMLTQSGYNTRTRSRVNSNIRATQDFGFLTPGLTAYAMFAFDYYNQNAALRRRTPDTFYASGRDEDGNLIFEQTRVGNPYLGFERGEQENNRRFYTEAAVNYVRSFEKHNVTGMILFNQSDYINSQAGDLIGSLPYRYRGIAGRATYDYANRYLLELNFGFNGSENFLPSKRYGFFPSVGLGWVFSEEPFFESLKNAIPLGKIRFSRGVVGNADIGGRRFAYIGTVGDTDGYHFGDQYNNEYWGRDIEEYAVDVTWEKALKTNVGIDLNTLGGALNLQFDVFHERREGSFLRRAAIPAYVGLRNNPYGNLGKTENKGVDASLTYNGQLSRDFTLNVQGTVTFNRNEVIDDDLPPWNYPWRERKGQRIDQRFGYIAEGLFQSQDEIDSHAMQIGNTMPGDIKYLDLNGDGVIDANDQAPIGYGQIPELVYGLRIGFNYKNFSMAAFFQGAGNVDIMTSGQGFTPFTQGVSSGNLLTAIEDRWTEENPLPNPLYPRLTFGDENMNYRASSWWVQDMSYVRLKTLDIGYTIDNSFINRIGLKKATIFMQGFNLLTFSKFDLWDVEIESGNGISYPQVKTYNLGIQANF